MKNLRILFFVLPLALGFIACNSKPSVAGDSFGAGVSRPESAVAFADVIKGLETTDSMNVVLKAKVDGVCQAKGCWMNLVDPTAASDKTLFVKFKDYGFFMPKDIAGREVLIEGKAYKEQTTVEELRHYAEDAHKSEDEIAKITEPVTEMKFMASGVILVD